MTLYRLDASIFPATSASRSLADLVEQRWIAAHPGSTVTRRDLGAEPIPATAWLNAVSAGFVAESDRSPSSARPLHWPPPSWTR